MNTRNIGVSCVLALLCISNAWGASVYSPIDLGNPGYDDFCVTTVKAKDNLIAGVASEILHKGPKYNLHIFDRKIVSRNGRRFSEDLGKIKSDEPHAGNIAAPSSSAIILFGSAIVGLVVVGRRIPDTSQGDAPA
jgi:hypothetical protein